MGGLWTQKCVKNKSFLRVLKRLFFGFEAPDGPLGLILAAYWANLVPKLGHEMGNKSAADRYQKMGFICLIKSNNNLFWFYFWFLFGLLSGPIFESILNSKFGSKFVNFWVNFGSLFLGV